MNLLWGLLLILSVLPQVELADQKPAFLVTCAKQIRVGLPFSVNVILLEQFITTDFDVSIVSDAGKVITQAQINMVGKIKGDQGKLDMQIPAGAAAGMYTLKVDVVSNNYGFKASQSKSIEIVEKSGLILVQTDKGIYKPGQTVKMRILVLFENLVPQAKHVDISVKDPEGNKMEQWKNVDTKFGVAKRELQLANELPLGKWTIQASVAGSLDMLSEAEFTVDKYVLPRFSVNLNLPSNFVVYRPQDTAIFDFSLESKYTYGKPVKGVATVWIKQDQNQEKKIKKDLDSDGRASFSETLGKSSLMNKYSYYFCREPPMITVTATVEEDKTGIEETTSGSVEIKAKQFEISFENVDPSFSPGTPYTANVKVLDMERDDGVIPSNQRGKFEIKIFLNGSDGKQYAREEFRMPLGDETVFVKTLSVPQMDLQKQPYFRLHLQAMLFVDGILKSSTDTQYINQFFSNSTMGLKLNMWHPKAGEKGYVVYSGQKFEKNQDVWFKTYSQSNTKVFYEVYSKGKMLSNGYSSSALVQDTKDLYESNFKVGITEDNTPETTILVYTVTSSGEVLADSLDFTVTGLINEKAAVEFDQKEVDVATNVQLTVNSNDKRKSYVGIVSIDKSSLLLKEPNDITPTLIDTKLKGLGLSKKKEFDNYECYCGCWMFKRKRRSVLKSNQYGESAYNVIEDVGVIMLTDAVIMSSEKSEGFGGGFPVFADMLEKTSETSQTNPSPSESSSSNKVRKNFPETWIFDDMYTSDDGIYKGTYKVPDTITSWITTAFAINNVTGLILAPDKAKITAFRKFFIVLNLPYSVKRGESFPLEIFVFNYLPDDIKAEVVLEASDSFGAWPVDADAKALGNEANAVKAERRSFVDIVSQGSAGMKVWILPRKLGKIKINARAKHMTHEDILSGLLLVEPEGIRKRTSVPRVIDVADDTDRYSVEVKRDSSNIVPDSQTLGISVVGDIMGTSLNNLDRLIRAPYGCGEQNMISLVPNIFAMKYLKSVERLSADIKERAENNMKQGYQRELNYRLKDGSFSAFGESDGIGSTWLTAFVVRSFVQADEFISVDKAVIAKSVSWLLKQYNEKGSYFIERGKVHHSDMQGGSGQKGLSLTVYVFISLFEADSKMNLDNEVKGLSTKVTQIKGKLEEEFKSTGTSMTNFELSILAYAFSLTGSSYTDQALSLLKERSTEFEGFIFWKKSPTEEVKPWDDKGGRRCWAPPVPTPSQIEISSYTLLAYITKSKFVDSRPIVKWMIAQMSEIGGFRSTQDTVMGLMSLSEYASKTAKDDSMSISFAITAGASQETITVDTSNKFLVQTKTLPSDADFVDVVATGKGMAQVVVFWRYNVESVVDDDSELIEVDTEINGISHEIYDLKIGVRYKSRDPTSMGLVTVGLLSGFSVDTVDVENRNKGTVKRVEVNSEEVVMYINQFTSQRQMYYVRAKRVFGVADMKGASVTAQLYYSPDQLKRVRYDAPSLIKLNRCQLNGNLDTCPLPRVPSSAVGISSGFMSLVTILVAMVFSKYF